MKTIKNNPNNGALVRAAGTLKSIAWFIVCEAARQGATDSEVMISSSKSVDIAVRLGDVEQLEGANGRGINLCVYIGGKSAASTTSDFKRRALRKLIADTIALALASEADPFAGLPDAKYLATSAPDLGLYDPVIAAMPVEEKIQLALATEKAALNADKRITNSAGGGYSDRVGITVYANSRGFLDSCCGTRCQLGVSVLAGEGGEMQCDAWSSGGRWFKDLESPEAIGRMAAERTVRLLGACQVKTQVVPVVVDQLMAAQLLAQFVGAARGSSIYKKSSFLVGQLGEVVASGLVTIIDDPTMPGKIGSRGFDSEGMPLLRRTIVSAGILETYLVDAYSARKLNCEPNSGETGNVYLQAGDLTAEQIIASVNNGLYLTSISGPGFNAVTGECSYGAGGMWIKDGKLAFPVNGITVSGMMLDIFKGIIAVGNDLEFRAPFSSPTILIDKITVAGAGE